MKFKYKKIVSPKCLPRIETKHLKSVLVGGPGHPVRSQLTDYSDRLTSPCRATKDDATNATC